MTGPAVTAATGSEAPVVPAVPVVETPAVVDNRSAIAIAADKARETIAKAASDKQAAGKETPAAAIPANETAEQKQAREDLELIRSTETPEETAAREAQEAATAAGTEGDAALRASLPAVADGQDPLDIEFGDPESAERVRELSAGYVRGKQARAIYDGAQALRDDAENMTYAVEADPGGFVSSVIQRPADMDHLLKYLATRPGVLERNAEYLAGLIEKPDAIEGQSAILEAERIKRRDVVSGQVAIKKEVNANARKIVGTLDTTLDTVMPEGWSADQKAAFREDCLTDIRAFAREKQLRTVDLRVVPGIVQGRLKRYGVSPRSAGVPAVPTKEVKSVAPEVTAEALVKARARRAAASSAPPGAGSPIAAVTKPPAFDPKQPGNAIQQAARFARTLIPGLVKRV